MSPTLGWTVSTRGPASPLEPSLEASRLLLFHSTAAVPGPWLPPQSLPARPRTAALLPCGGLCCRPRPRPEAGGSGSVMWLPRLTLRERGAHHSTTDRPESSHLGPGEAASACRDSEVPTRARPRSQPNGQSSSRSATTGPDVYVYSSGHSSELHIPARDAEAFPERPSPAEVPPPFLCPWSPSASVLIPISTSNYLINLSTCLFWMSLPSRRSDLPGRRHDILRES